MFKSFDGWVAVVSDRDSTSKKILAQFTRDDDTLAYYNAAAVRRMKDKPSETMTRNDKKLVAEASVQAPRFFRAYDGWRDIGRGKKNIMIAAFTDATGARKTYGLASLHRMAASPPPKFAAADKVFLSTAIEDGPVRR